MPGLRQLSQDQVRSSATFWSSRTFMWGIANSYSRNLTTGTARCFSRPAEVGQRTSSTCRTYPKALFVK